MRGKKNCSQSLLLERTGCIPFDKYNDKKGPFCSTTQQYNYHRNKTGPSFSLITHFFYSIKCNGPARTQELISCLSRTFFDDGCIIGLDSTKLVVLKNNKIVLKDTRNLVEGLWDILLEKTTIQCFNHHPPSTHAGMYLTRHVLPPTAQKVRTLPRDNQPQQLSAFHVAKIQTQLLDRLMTHGSKQDATWELHRINLNDCHHKLAGIVRKQHTNRNLSNAYMQPGCHLSRPPTSKPSKTQLPHVARINNGSSK